MFDRTHSGASQAILELAQSDGWYALYDPSNEVGRELSGESIVKMDDLLGNLPSALPKLSETPPRWNPDAFNGYGAADFGYADSLNVLQTRAFDRPLGQPAFIMALGQSRATTTHKRGRFLIDAISPTNRQAIFASGVFGDRWAVYAGNEFASNVPMDIEPHVFGFEVFGPHGEEGSKFYLDGNRQVGRVLGNNTQNVHALSGITFGTDHRVSANRYWDGFLGPVLLYNGIPSQAVRDRMTRLLKAFAVGTGNVKIDRLNSTAAVLVNQDRSVEFGKNADKLQVPASMTKLLTGYVVRQVIGNDRLEETTVLTEADTLTGSSPILEVGDEISYSDLLHLVMLPSHNVSVGILVSRVGAQLPGSGLPAERFIDRMNALAAEWGWDGATFPSASGLSTANHATPRQIADLLWRIYEEDPEYTKILSTIRHDVHLGGPNARTIVAIHIIQPQSIPSFPEFIAGKTGNLFATGSCVAMIVDSPKGKQAVVTMSAQPARERFWDARKILDGTATLEVNKSRTGLAVENNIMQSLENPTSETRHKLDALYGTREGICETATTSIVGTGIPINSKLHFSRTTEGLVEMQIRRLKLPRDFASDSLIPIGYRPHQIAYGNCTMRLENSIATVEVIINPKGNIQFYGNDAGQPLRGTMTWITNDSGPRTHI